MAPRNHAGCVGSYCDAILSGEIIAGRYVELAVRRYLDDLEHAHERGLYFDAEIAEKSLQFVETVCTHQKAEWAGQPFTRIEAAAGLAAGLGERVSSLESRVLRIEVELENA